MKTRTQIQIKGIVQGVGFRPFVFALAEKNALKGRVFNNGNGVLIDIEGKNQSIEQFIKAIKTTPPPLSFIESVEFEELNQIADFSDFRIIESSSNGNKFTPISPDVSTCEDCLREMFDENDRRFLYPFINCTNCGPRFTIIKDIPYDREMTTMREFEMCEPCRAEYENPRDRRFHAEPTACENCGPKIWFAERLESAVGESVSSVSILKTQTALKNGKIVAIKGIGGFHLACDARNDKAIEILRERKGRVDKPFAVMVKDLETAKTLVEIDQAEESILTGKERPVVLLKRKSDELSELIAPNNRFLGVMLPYSPLHYLLFDSNSFQSPDVLVMTSGNFSNEPIVKDNVEALENLSHLADSFLLHNREIYVQCDDSVVRVLESPKSENQILPIRRSRGYAPFPVELPFEVPNILAVGGELKAAFCLTKKNFAFMSQHIGDMENLETLRSFERSLEQMKALFRVEPEIIACDKHPGYLSTKWARENASKFGAELIAVQHHHAHIASVMAENGLPNEKVIGFAFDGTGFGDDGNIWGGEVLIADYKGFERAAHLDYFPLAGGDASIKKPYRVALSLLKEANIEWNEKFGCVSFCSETERKILAKQLEKNLNVFSTSSFGRFFDAVASLSNVCQKVTYEAQAAIEFESMIDENRSESYKFDLRAGGTILIDWKNLIRAVVRDVLADLPIPVISAKFHNAVANLILDLSFEMRKQFGINKIALSGGCFQNIVLLQKTISYLNENGFEVFGHSKVPPNDGGLALGQAVVACHNKAKGKR